MNQRECKQCHQVKELNPENFYVDESRGKDGYRVTCIPCLRARRKELYEVSDKSVHKERMKQYREANIERITEQRKQFREANKERINQAKSEKGKEKVTCECGAILRRDGVSRHLKTTQHENYIRQKA